MGKVYGERWEVLGDLGKGGQGVVFRVRDRSNQVTEPCVLKRVIHAKRSDRFVNEVTACKSLSHPNIITVLDHSALDAAGDDDEKMFLVMPEMADGNLERRAAVYKNSLDSTLQVGMVLADALSHAHEKGIIHRDVKPENILFPDPGHRAVLADFGICLIRDTKRATEPDEAVGPWAFMAPELEGGGQLVVTPAADVYSLSKVIYFMLSGGTVLPRERHREPGFEICAGPGKTTRHELLGKFFDRTICLADKRIQTVAEARAELERIAKWEPPAASAISSRALESFARLRQQKEIARSTDENNRAVSALETAQVHEYQDRVGKWAIAKINELIELFKQQETDATQVSEARRKQIHARTPGVPQARIRGRGEANHGQLIVERGLEVPPGPHGMNRSHCLLLRAYVQPVQPFFPGDRTKHEARDLRVTFMPYYFADEGWHGYFSREGRSPRHMHTVDPLPGSISEGYNHAIVQCVSNISKWPADLPAYEEAVAFALDIFLDRLAIWNDPSGLGLSLG